MKKGTAVEHEDGAAARVLHGAKKAFSRHKHSENKNKDGISILVFIGIYANYLAEISCRFSYKTRRKEMAKPARRSKAPRKNESGV